MKTALRCILAAVLLISCSGCWEYDRGRYGDRDWDRDRDRHERGEHERGDYGDRDRGDRDRRY